MTKQIIKHLCMATMVMGIALAATAMAGEEHVPSKKLQSAFDFVTKDLPNGLPAELRITSSQLNANIGFEANRKLSLKDVKSGIYNVSFPDISFAGYTFTAKQPLISLQLNKDRTIFERVKKRPLTNPITLGYKVTKMPATVSSNAVYPTNTAGLWSCNPVILNACIQLYTAAEIGNSTAVVEGNG